MRTPLSGGSLIRGAVSRRAVLASFPWISLPHYRASKLCTNSLARGDRTGNLQSLALEHVLEQLRKAQGIYRLAPNVEATVTGRGKHLGIAVSWNLRWTASGCFSEEIRGPQLTFKWGYDGREDSGCWEVDSSGLVRILECDDHEAVLMTTYIRTGCWLQPRLKDRFDMELLPKPPMSPTATSGSSSSSSGRRSAVPDGGAVAKGGDAGRNAPTQDSDSSSSHKQQRSAIPATTATAAATASAAPVRSASDCDDGGTGGHKPATAMTHGSRPSGATPALDDVVAIGLRLKGRKLRVRVLVRRRDWRLLGFDHRMCADVETWELGEWKEWAEGVQYPSSALHKASNGGQHAYLTVSGAAEHMAPPPHLPEMLLPPAIAGAAAVTTSSSLSSSSPPLGSEVVNDSSGRTAGSPVSRSSPNLFAVTGLTAALQLPPPTDFGLPLLPPIPGDTSYCLPGGKAAVPLWRSASGHFLVRPSVNGQPGGGYFVLDTGASGFVVTPQAAARLGGQSFGETHAASISGKVAARFVRIGSWCLGGLCIQQPVLMVMALDGLVRGAPGEVVGIVGHDLFRRAVVEVPQLLEVKGRGAFATEEGVVSGSDSGSGSEGEDHGTAAVSFVSRGSEDSTAAAAPSVSALYAGGGDGSSSGAPFGPPPSPLRSTPVFDDFGAAAALGQPPSVAAAAVPSPTVVQEPSSSPLCFAVPLETHGKPGSHLTPGSSVTAAEEETSTSDTRINSRSRFAARAGASCSSNDSTSRSSRNGSGESAVARASAGRSATARAVRRAALTVPYTMHEMMLHHPLEYGNESDWVWEPLVMIANLPHVHLRFADHGGGPPRSVLLMVDSGACGADLMLHSRAQKELGLLPAATEGGPSGSAGGGGGGASAAGKSQAHYLRGVGQEPRDFVQLQVLDVPWLEVAGVRFEQIRCMCAAVGGLDISIYSHGILCGDLLARLDWAIDYTHKRIGFRHGAFAPAPASTPLLRK
ncbi:hypothetical protein Vafri_18699 [Volvox africanus]|uniref:Uncharacterized protein n=1 Tax=Volvox africanus TaxID=51714 RepID=A0A8J4BMT9_9CHLO|nr:hypothetical protein Vafri_18699 [Volvox africanus]